MHLSFALCIALAVTAPDPGRDSPNDDATWPLTEPIENGSAFDGVRRARFACAPNSLYMFLRLTGAPVSYADSQAQLSVGPRGTSMLQLCGAASRLGAQTSVYHGDISALRKTAMPVIASLKPGDVRSVTGHFVVVLSVDDDSIMVLDGTTAAKVKFTHSLFQDLWSGHVLARSKAGAGIWHPCALALTVCNLSLMVALCFGASAGRLKSVFSARRAIGTCLGVVMGALLNGLGSPGVAEDEVEAPAFAAWRAAENDIVNCAYLLARVHGRDVSYDDVWRASSSGGNKAKVLAFRDLAGSLGLSLTIHKLSPAELARAAGPLVVVVDGAEAGRERLVILTGHDPEGYYTIDGGFATFSIVPDDDFRRSWTGYVLLPSRTRPRPIWSAVASSMLFLGTIAGYYRIRRRAPPNEIGRGSGRVGLARAAACPRSESPAAALSGDGGPSLAQGELVPPYDRKPALCSVPEIPTRSGARR